MKFEEYAQLLKAYVKKQSKIEEPIYDKKIELKGLPEKIYVFTSSKPKFCEIFSFDTGFYMRTGVLDDNWKDTEEDPLYRSYPQLIDIGVMRRCSCAKRCAIDCYQGARQMGSNMSLKNYKWLIDQISPYVFTAALGGAGNVCDHKHFEELLSYANEKGIKPNFTDSGLTFTPEKIKIIKKYCGACAISLHPVNNDYSQMQPYTKNAIDNLIAAGVKTNIHYVLSKVSIDDAIRRLEEDDWPEGLNAVVFLLYKDVGLGVKEKVLEVTDPRVLKFFSAVDNYKGKIKIGFDACTVCGVSQFMKNVDNASIDSCEAMRHTMYIDAQMHAMPCSFANQNPLYHIKIDDNFTIKKYWDSTLANIFRKRAGYRCPGCPHKDQCRGGCPLLPHIDLCNRPERKEDSSYFVETVIN